MRRVVAFIVAGLAAAAPAQAGTLIHPAHWRYQNWMAGSRMPAPPGPMTFHLKACPVAGGSSCVIHYTGGVRPDDVYVDPAAADQRAVFLHEIGHVFRHRTMTAYDRRRFSRLIGREGRGWMWGAPPTNELFASAYSDCATGQRSYQYGWDPAPELRRRACDLIVRAGRRRWLRVTGLTL